MTDDYTNLPKLPKNTTWKDEETFYYEDLSGDIAMRKTRRTAWLGKDPILNPSGKQRKEFPQFWVKYGGPKPKHQRGLLYHVKKIHEAVKLQRRIYLPEGEGKVNLMRLWGFDATCADGGALYWTMDHAEELYGAVVIIMPDNDQRGRDHSDKIGRTLINGFARSVHILEMPPEYGDVKNWIEAGHTKEEFEELLKTNLRDWKPYGPPPKTKDSAYDYEYASDIPGRPIDWFWENRLARRKVNVLFGPPEHGKSTLAIYFAAVASRGGEWPGGSHVPKGKFIIISGEDDWDDTIVPRLEVNEADMTQIVHLKMEGEWFDLTHDLPRLANTIKEIEGVIGVVIDPATAFLSRPGKTDSHRQADVRAILGPLNELAREYNLVILIVLHPNKDTNTSSILAWISGSSAFGEAPRIVQLVIEDKQDEDPNPRVLVLKAKNNLIPRDLDTRIAFKRIKVPASTGDSVPKVEWDNDPVTITPHEAMRNFQRPEGDRKSAEEVRAWIVSKLFRGPLPAKSLEEAAKAENITQSQLDGARRKMVKEKEIDKRQIKGDERYWEWYLVGWSEPHPLDTLPQTGGNGRPPQ
jgi:hypothetical protein